jgi:hypothetical protein
MSNSPQNYQDFVSNLVAFVTGVEISDIPDDKKKEIVDEVINLYFEYIEKYLEENKGKKAKTQYMIIQSREDLSLYNRFEGLEEGVKEAHQSFINNISTI